MVTEFLVYLLPVQFLPDILFYPAWGLALPTLVDFRLVLLSSRFTLSAVLYYYTSIYFFVVRRNKLMGQSGVDFEPPTSTFKKS